MISSKEALIALANGEKVEVHESTYKKDVWFDLVKTNFNVEEILKGKVDNKPYTLKFHLKPRTITLNGIEVPAPFEPKVGDTYFCIWPMSATTYVGEGVFVSDDVDRLPTMFGAWRTRVEAEKAVEVLRNVFNP